MRAFQNISGLGKRFSIMDLIDTADICPTLNKLRSLPLPVGFRFCQQNAIQHFQEKQKGRNKLVPRLLGVTKDSVLRLDEKTKEILKTWPLTTVKRWAASPNVFTLDFGDYQDQYYSVQTTEGEHISALIAGYIDIILKRRQRKERFGEDGNEEEAMEKAKLLITKVLLQNLQKVPLHCSLLPMPTSCPSPSGRARSALP